jgi:hypothetical protein
MPVRGRSTRRPTSGRSAESPGAGIGIDRYGAGAIDPSENVLALVNAQSIFQEKIDAADHLNLDALCKFTAHNHALHIAAIESSSSTRNGSRRSLSTRPTAPSMSTRASGRFRSRWRKRSSARWRSTLRVASIAHNNYLPNFSETERANKQLSDEWLKTAIDFFGCATFSFGTLTRRAAL